MQTSFFFFFFLVSLSSQQSPSIEQKCRRYRLLEVASHDFSQLKLLLNWSLFEDRSSKLALDCHQKNRGKTLILYANPASFLFGSEFLITTHLHQTILASSRSAKPAVIVVSSCLNLSQFDRRTMSTILSFFFFFFFAFGSAKRIFKHAYIYRRRSWWINYTTTWVQILERLFGFYPWERHESNYSPFYYG